MNVGEDKGDRRNGEWEMGGRKERIRRDGGLLDLACVVVVRRFLKGVLLCDSSDDQLL